MDVLVAPLSLPTPKRTRRDYSGPLGAELASLTGSRSQARKRLIVTRVGALSSMASTEFADVFGPTATIDAYLVEDMRVKAGSMDLSGFPRFMDDAAAACQKS